MGPFGNGWALALNGVVLTSGCSGDTTPEDTTEERNLIIDPSFEGDTMPTWEATNSAESTAALTEDESYAGTQSVQIDATATTAADMGVQLVDPDALITVIEGEHVWGSGWFLTGDAVSGDTQVTVSFYEEDDTLISSVTSTVGTALAGAWTRNSVDGVAPALTAKAGVALNFVGGATNGDTVGWIDAAMLTVSDTLVDWFDGDTLDTAYYGYAWDGAENETSSTRTPCVLIYGTTILEALTDTPKGLGHPEIRTEDTTYAQRDGVVHWNDYYGPRFITVVASLHPEGHCDDPESCLVVRTNRSLLSQAWKRQCNDIELVLYPPCEAGTDVEQRTITGPYGIVGRPRVFESEWLYRDEQIADVLLRFDGTDHRIYVLDPCGTPGLSECYQIDAGTFETCATLPWCFEDDGTGVCFDTPVEGTSEPVEVTIAGTECVNPTLTLYPGMVRPRIINQTTGDWIGYNTTVIGEPVVIDTLNGTATQNGEDVTANLIGSLQFKMNPGEYEIQVVSFGLDDDGYVDFCYRPTVLVA
jgi:hypothetical protein